MPKEDTTKFPSLKEIDIMTVFHSDQHECTALCQDLLGAIEELAGATGIKRMRLLARIRAIRGRMLELKCGLCLPE